jgi:biopolymer transport protein ExbD
MPIRFRCTHCRQLLSVASRKAGQSVNCPSCQGALVVPTPDEPPPSAPLEAEASADESSPLDLRELRSPLDYRRSTPEPGDASATSESAPGDEEVDSLARAPAVAADGGGDDEEFQLRRPTTDFEEMDLTPMVDVTFLLLIFFMITASFNVQKSIEVPAPSPDDQGAATVQTLDDFEANSIIVEVDAQNTIFVDYERLSHVGELVDTLRDKMSLKQELVIDAHADAFHETVIHIIDAANAVGMQKIRLASRGG